MSRSNKKKKREREFIYLFIYGCCPGGLCPEEVSQACLILAATGAATDETSIATDRATAIAASDANVTLFVLISSHDITDYED
jgi:hypothetical protein